MFWKQPTHLISEQLKKASQIEKKWESHIFPEKAIDPKHATEAITTAYAAVGLPLPQVVFCESPYAALGHILENLVGDLEQQLIERVEIYLNQCGPDLNSQLAQFLVHNLGISLRKQSSETLGKPQSDLLKKLRQPLIDRPERRLSVDKLSLIKQRLSNPPLKHSLTDLVEKQIGRLHMQMVACLVRKLRHRINDKSVFSQLKRLEILLQHQQFSRFVHRLGKQLSQYIAYDQCIYPELWAVQAVWWDFCINILNCKYDSEKWSAFHGLTTRCGWVLPYEKVCFVCSRPIKLSFDVNERLHGEGEFSVLYEDGYGLYFHHGVALPKKYGQVKPENWVAEWVLNENNAELRRILIQGIGYERICKELNASEVDSWQEYTLLKLNELVDDIDGQSISLLKMICPSTNFIHTIRVPPNLQSAREAIRWVNWGIYPEQFAQQS
ncbi:hypothetical protein DXZ20_19350 [Leptolyngbyaceae cyanobacterium CCMR0081]|uniref:DUF6745 domain-containing protein n=1 Tax=Adonisia turfae CCMR0081 TaxID=2292702 RepID=A0A6M0RPS1_9CYAN|nr:hypothetical protein [Adonisia turfae CCMR0081]